jgi:Cu(I)/Ag(I) efflux system membrane protein CusA/SilA
MLKFNISIAVIVGFLALLGFAAEISIVMSIYLKEAIDDKKKKLGINISKRDIKQAIYDGVAQRLRPKLMTVFAVLDGLITIMYNYNVGSTVIQNIAAAMIGGMVSLSILTKIEISLIIYIAKNYRVNNKLKKYI